MKTDGTRVHRFVLGFLALVFACTAWADGDPDAGFGNAGQVMIERIGVPPTTDALLGDVAVMPNGKSVWVMENGSSEVVVGRLHRDGSRDASFGN